MWKAMHTLAKVRRKGSRIEGSEWTVFASLKDLLFAFSIVCHHPFYDTFASLVSVILPCKAMEIDTSLSCQKREDLPLLGSTNSCRKRWWTHSFLGLAFPSGGWGWGGEQLFGWALAELSVKEAKRKHRQREHWSWSAENVQKAVKKIYFGFNQRSYLLQAPFFYFLGEGWIDGWMDEPEIADSTLKNRPRKKKKSDLIASMLSSQLIKLR